MGIPAIEQFAKKIQDVGAHKGAFVSASGFTSTAPKYAEAMGLNLYKLIDLGEHDWKSIVSIPVLCDFRRVDNYCFKFIADVAASKFLKEIMQHEADQRNIILYNDRFEELGKVVEFVDQKLQKSKSLFSPRQHDVIFPNDRIMMKYGLNIKI